METKDVDSRNINIGMIGAGFMAKLHSIAYRNYPMYFYPPAAMPVLHTVCDVAGSGGDCGASLRLSAHAT